MARADPETWDAARVNDVDKLKALLEAGTEASEATQPLNWTALHVAAGHDAVEAAALLLERGASVDARCSDQETPLHLAAQEGKTNAIQFLLDNNADIEAKNKDGETPLHVAVQHVGSKPLEHVQLLVESRADTSAKDEEGHTALAKARLLTNRGPELEVILGSDEPNPLSGADMETMVLSACQFGNVDLVKHFLEQTSDKAAVAQRALVTAAQNGNVAMAEVLLEAGADPTMAAVNDAGMFPMLAAADEKQPKMVRWLLANLADPNELSCDGANALMAASLRGSNESVTALLEAGSYVDAQAQAEWTALMAAAQSGHATVARQLLDGNATMELTNAEGATARQLALGNGKNDVVKVLDTRAKIEARRAKAAPSASETKEDNRNLDDLLAALGEAQGPGKKSKKKAKQEGAKEEEPTPAAKAKPEPLLQLKAKCKAAPESKPAEPKAQEELKSKKKGKSKAEKEAEKLEALQKRLADIAVAKKSLEKEEAQIRKQLAQLS